MRAHALFRGAHEMNSNDPFVERDMRIFKDSANGNSERLAAVFTLPQTLTRLASATRFQFTFGLVLVDNRSRLRREFVGFTYKAAMWTFRAVRPALLLKVFSGLFYRCESFHQVC